MAHEVNTQIEHDPDYELVTVPPKAKRGRQCGKCGLKFEYGTTYGFSCQDNQCPMGYCDNGPL
jgi:hypothetical protein